MWVEEDSNIWDSFLVAIKPFVNNVSGLVYVHTHYFPRKPRTIDSCDIGVGNRAELEVL